MSSLYVRNSSHNLVCLHLQDIVAPPPPIFSTPGAITRQFFEEKGEADMDVDMHHSSGNYALPVSTTRPITQNSLPDEPLPHYETSSSTWTAAGAPLVQQQQQAWNKQPEQHHHPNNNRSRPYNQQQNREEFWNL